MKRSIIIRPFIHILTLMTIFLSAEASQAATLYVATTGNDTNSGTQALPFRTLLKGVRALTAGDTLIVRGGAYNEGLPNVIPSGTSWSQPVTVKSAPGETVILKTLMIADGLVSFVGAGTHYIILDGFVLDANHLAIFAFATDAGANYIRVMNCEIKNSRASGLLVGGQGHEIINVDVHDNGSTGFHHGLYLAGSQSLVERSRFYNNAGYGTQLYNAAGGVNDNIVRGNVFHDNGSGGLWAGKGVRALIINNALYANGGHNLILSSRDAGVYNNTVYGAKGTPKDRGIGIVFLNDQGNDVANNISYGNPGGDVYGLTSATVKTNLFGTDPKFVDAAHADFRLQSSSPAINAGTPRSQVTTDIGRGLAAARKWL